jgi:hypothetical protein
MPTAIWTTKLNGMAHKKLIPLTPVISSQKLIAMTTAKPATTPTQVPNPVAHRTNIAMQNKPNNGAESRLTTL